LLLRRFSPAPVTEGRGGEGRGGVNTLPKRGYIRTPKNV
jgi:hypothetical protein